MSASSRQICLQTPECDCPLFHSRRQLNKPKDNINTATGTSGTKKNYHDVKIFEPIGTFRKMKKYKRRNKGKIIWNSTKERDKKEHDNDKNLTTHMNNYFMVAEGCWNSPTTNDAVDGVEMMANPLTSFAESDKHRINGNHQCRNEHAVTSSGPTVTIAGDKFRLKIPKVKLELERTPISVLDDGGSGLQTMKTDFPYSDLKNIKMENHYDDDSDDTISEAATEIIIYDSDDDIRHRTLINSLKNDNLERMSQGSSINSCLTEPCNKEANFFQVNNAPDEQIQLYKVETKLVTSPLGEPAVSEQLKSKENGNGESTLSENYSLDENSKSEVSTATIISQDVEVQQVANVVKDGQESLLSILVVNYNLDFSPPDQVMQQHPDVTIDTGSAASDSFSHEDHHPPVESLRKISPSVCQVCDRGFKNKFNLKRHIATHTGFKYSCTACNAVFRHLSSRARDVCLNVHQKSCTDSLKSTIRTSEGVSKSHSGNCLRNLHFNKKPKISNSTALPVPSTSSDSESHTNNFNCVFCTTSFKFRVQLKLHLAYDHDIRDQRSKSNLGKDGRNKTNCLKGLEASKPQPTVSPASVSLKNGKTVGSSATELTPSPQTLLHCPICEKNIQSGKPSRLKEHMMAHTGFKYHCSACSSSFRYLSRHIYSLNFHKKSCSGSSNPEGINNINAGVSALNSSASNNELNTSSLLSTSSQQHESSTNEYECVFCKRTFNERVELKLHLANDHDERKARSQQKQIANNQIMNK